MGSHQSTWPAGTPCALSLLLCPIRGLVKILPQCTECTHEGLQTGKLRFLFPVCPARCLPPAPKSPPGYQVKLQVLKAGRTRVRLKEGLPRNLITMGSALVVTKPGWPRRYIIWGSYLVIWGQASLDWTILESLVAVSQEMIGTGAPLRRKEGLEVSSNTQDFGKLAQERGPKGRVLVGESETQKGTVTVSAVPPPILGAPKGGGPGLPHPHNPCPWPRGDI